MRLQPILILLLLYLKMASTEDSQIIKDLVSAEENIPTSREATPLLGNKGRRINA
jgi:hypothetical protein